MTSQVKESAAKANAGKRDASKKLDYQPDPANILEVRNLSKHFNIKTGLFSSLPLKAVDDVSFFIRHKETLGLVGESGCGKTTVGRALMWLYPPTAGDVYFNGSLISEKNVRSLRRNMQMVFQDPYSSLNPRMTVEDIIGESLSIHKIFKTKKEQRERVYDLMRLVGLNKEHATRYAHEFSGGQRQRIGIARALAINPKFIVCDESVSALDVSIQAQILNMFKDLQDQLNLSYLFIAHDILVVTYMSDRIAVMYLGKMVEQAKTDEINSNPIHPYTQSLFSAVPIPDPRTARESHRIVLEGDVPSPLHVPSGCAFRTRCPYATEQCALETPPFEDRGGEHFVACWNR
ncbi:MAG TPA: ABC transporter ATP-binding protein [Bacillota bacterium]|jgi:oligopeptide transport system ATP-binding protein|nr:ABC transporter ATP-binding protein [Fastidiosipila sp.]HPX93748.1 ABC transporter ATP-binding protein [Bacillota bacterium]HQB81581.1 ABC transporter ATP-binding protein [Bacillota bacterium]